MDVPPHTRTRVHADTHRLSVDRSIRWRQNSVRVCTPTQFLCAYANTVYRPYMLLLPPLPVTVPFAVVDPTKELLSEWFLSVDLCGRGTDLFSLLSALI